jgi:hypothetical protein
MGGDGGAGGCGAGAGGDGGAGGGGAGAGGGVGCSGPYRCGAGRTLARPVCTVGFTGCNRGPAGRAGSVAFAAPGCPAADAWPALAGGDDAEGSTGAGKAAGSAEAPGSEAGTGSDACSGPSCVPLKAPSSYPVEILGQTTYVGRRAVN